MKTALLTILLMTTASIPAFAKDKTDGKSGSVAVEKLICSKLYVPATGAASPTYQAGVDVNGKAVAPADISSVPMVNTPDYIEVPMAIDLAQKLGTSPTGAEMKLPVANLKLYKDGRVEYNGQDITSNAGALCGVAQTGAPKDENNKTPAQVAPASGHEKTMMSAPSAPSAAPMAYVPPIQPEETVPQAGSVAASSTTPPPKIIYKLQQGTAAKSISQ